MSRESVLVSFVLATIVSVSGCATKDPTSPPTPTINQTTSIFTLKPEMVDCRFFVAGFQALSSEIRPLLPDGYELDATASAVAAEVQIEVYDCEAIILNNETVIPHAALFILDPRVAVKETLAAGAEYHQYALEILASNHTVVNLWNSWGFQADLAEITIQSGAPYALSVEVDGKLWYKVTGARWTPFAGETTVDLRSHQQSEAGRPLWFDFLMTDHMPNDTGQGTLEVYDGVAKTLVPTDQGLIQARSWLGTGHGQIEFGRFP